MGKKKKKPMSKEKKKGLFMKIIIIYCLAFMAVTNIWALFILQNKGHNAAPIINAINMVHGGELLLCCVKKILSDPVSSSKLKRKKNSDETVTEDTSDLEQKEQEYESSMTKEFEENHSGLRGE